MRLSLTCFLLAKGGSLATSIHNEHSLLDTQRRAPNTLPRCSLATPAPTGKVCGERGSYQYHKKTSSGLTNNQTISSFGACRDLVAPKNVGYRALSYNKTSELCTFYIYEIGKNGGIFTPSSKSDTIFYDTACFTCPAYNCPANKSANLIRDPSFESSSKYIGPWISIYFKPLAIAKRIYFPASIPVVSPGFNSNNALQIGSTDGLNLVAQYLAYYCLNEVYILQFDYLIHAPANSSGSTITLLGLSDVQSTTLSTAGTNGSYVSYQDIYTLPKEVDSPLIEFQIFPGTGKTVELTIDNFVVSPIASLPVMAKPGAQSLVSNGGFESGKLAPWAYSHENKKDSYSIVSPGLGNSTKAFQFTPGQTSSRFTIEHPIVLKTGSRYIWSVDIAGATVGPTVNIGRRQWIYSGPNGYQYINKTFSAPFIAQSDSTSFTITTVAFPDPKKFQSVEVDNASVKLLEQL